MSPAIELRLHGRGGQGGVTCAKILAAAYGRLGRYVQTFGDYAGERSGAPVRAYTRVADQPITNRNKVYRPDHLVVLDPTLLGPDTVAGLAPGGTLLLNTPEPLQALAGQYPMFRLAVIDATAIARKHRIGTRSVVIVNTTIAGAFARVHGLSLEILKEAYRDLGLLSNFEAATEAWETVAVREVEIEAGPADPVTLPSTLPDVLPVVEHVDSGPTGLKTGAWGTQEPCYVENLAPCNAWCPAGNDVVGFLQALVTDGETEAASILGRSTPLAAVCGRVCPAPCMEGCNRREYDGAVHIRGLERWVADHAPVAETRVAEVATPRRIAILGGGPAGLAAAYELARAGHRPTILDGEERLGGVLHTGIPTYRLPRDVLEAEIQGILALGVETRLGTFLSRADVAGLLDDYDGVILATGLQRLRDLDVEGAKLDGIEQGIGFLHRVNVDGGATVSGHVVVLGGGNTAMDCARSALRAGAVAVTVAYRRTRKEMPAIHEEVEEAEEEGVTLLLQSQPVAFHGNGRVEAIELADVEMGEPDASGRRRPVVSDRTTRLPCDHVLLAVGQSADESLLPTGWTLNDGRIHQNGDPLPVFAAGDLATGDGTVTHAIGNGRRAAGLVLRAVGETVDVFERPDRQAAVPITDIRLDHFAPTQPARERAEAPRTRVRSYDEVKQGLADALEAHRCFSCGHCTHCDTCLVYCPEGIIRRTNGEDGYEVDYSYCKGCGICVEECPRSAIEMGTP